MPVSRCARADVYARSSKVIVDDGGVGSATGVDAEADCENGCTNDAFFLRKQALNTCTSDSKNVYGWPPPPACLARRAMVASTFYGMTLAGCLFLGAPTLEGC